MDLVTVEAVRYIRNQRESGLTITEIYVDIASAYHAAGIDPGTPEDLFPDPLTLWLADCWELFGHHELLNIEGTA